MHLWKKLQISTLTGQEFEEVLLFFFEWKIVYEVFTPFNYKWL